MKYLQGEPLPQKLIAWGKEYRQSQQDRIERVLANQLLQPLQQVADIAPAFVSSPYTLTILGPENFTLRHEKNGLRFKSDELLPNGRPFSEQFQEVAERQRSSQQAPPPLSRNNELEM